MNLDTEKRDRNAGETERKKVKMILKNSFYNEEILQEIGEKIAELYSKDRKFNGYKRRIAKGFYLDPSTVEKLEFMKFIFKARDFNIDGSDIINIAVEVLYLLIEPDLNKFFYDKRKKRLTKNTDYVELQED